MKKVLGIGILLVVVCVATGIKNPDFFKVSNLENTLLWTSLYAIIGIGVAFVIITGGIDLSIGSVVGLTGVVLAGLLKQHDFSVPAALAVVFVMALAIGLAHGLLVTKMKLQPFIVTLCGLLIYRGLARYLAQDRNFGFGVEYDDLRYLAIGKPGFAVKSILLLVFMVVGVSLLFMGRDYLKHQVALWRGRVEPRFAVREQRMALAGYSLVGVSLVLCLLTLLGFNVPPGQQITIPMPFLLMLGIAIVASVFLNQTIWGRYTMALGANELAARYSGIRTDRITIIAYILSSMLGAFGGMLFCLKGNVVQPATTGSFYELYAIAAAVLGGCSLRGGEGSILGVVIGAALLRVLRNSINMVGISLQLEFAVIGLVILMGVTADEFVKRFVARRRLAAKRAEASPG